LLQCVQFKPFVRENLKIIKGSIQHFYTVKMKYISFKISKKRNFEEFKGDDYNIISFILK